MKLHTDASGTMLRAVLRREWAVVLASRREGDASDLRRNLPLDTLSCQIPCCNWPVERVIQTVTQSLGAPIKEYGACSKNCSPGEHFRSIHPQAKTLPGRHLNHFSVAGLYCAESVFDVRTPEGRMRRNCARTRIEHSGTGNGT